MQNKLTQVRSLLKENKCDAFITFVSQTRLWFTRMEASDGILIITDTESLLYVDGRYYEKAKTKAENVKIVLLDSSSLKKLKELKVKKALVESNYLTISDQNRMQKLFLIEEFKYINGQNLRIIKDEYEVEKIRKACSISLKALKYIEPIIKEGISELEISRKLADAQRKFGGEKNSFESIVVAGKNSSLPHGTPSEYIIQNGDLVTIDFGTVYRGFCSDITRVFEVGKIVDKELIKIKEILTIAQQMGKEAVRPGVTNTYIDKVCRDYITENGYGKYFVHSTGHGLGIDVHELPNVTSNKSMEITLKPGMVITVEPGIYMPNFGGLRIEDDVLVTEDGYEVLSKGE